MGSKTRDITYSVISYGVKPWSLVEIRYYSVWKLAQRTNGRAWSNIVNAGGKKKRVICIPRFYLPVIAGPVTAA